MHRLRSPSGAAVLRPQVVRTRVLRSKTLPQAGFTPAEEDKLWGSRSARSALWGAAAALAACEVLGI